MSDKIQSDRDLVRAIAANSLWDRQFAPPSLVRVAKRLQKQAAEQQAFNEMMDGEQ